MILNIRLFISHDLSSTANNNIIFDNSDLKNYERVIKTAVFDKTVYSTTATTAEKHFMFNDIID